MTSATLPPFDPFSPAYLRDPYPTMNALREATPAFYAPELGHWVVTRHRDIKAIFQSPDRFSAANALEPLSPVCPHAVAALRDGGYNAVRVLTDVDRPAHARQRRLVNVAFTPKRVAELEPYVREVARGFCEERLRDGRGDIMRDLAWALPALVLFRILGLPADALVRVKEGAYNRGVVIFGRSTEAEQVPAAEELASFWRYAASLVDARLEQPGDDFISALIEAQAGSEEKMSRDELASLMVVMLFAGHETTTNLIGNGFRRLLADRAAWDAICSDPSLIPNAVEEILRFDGSVVAWRHMALEAVEIGGVAVPAGAKLLLLLGAANRDPAVFPDPDRFDIRRANAREHLAFGTGMHLCLGAPLARLEARVVFEEVSARLPDLRLADDEVPPFPVSVSMRGPLALPVAWGGAQA